MRKPSLSLLLAVVVLLTSVALTACHRSRGATEARVPATEPGDPTVPPSASAATAAATDDKFGVPECDDFVKAYQACLDTASEGSRSYLQSNFDQMKARFRQLAATGQTRPALAETCLLTRQMMKPTLIVQGCMI